MRKLLLEAYKFKGDTCCLNLIVNEEEKVYWIATVADGWRIKMLEV